MKPENPFCLWKRELRFSRSVHLFAPPVPPPPLPSMIYQINHGAISDTTRPHLPPHFRLNDMTRTIRTIQPNRYHCEKSRQAGLDGISKSIQVAGGKPPTFLIVVDKSVRLSM